jgi:hypothetical protein
MFVINSSTKEKSLVRLLVGWSRDWLRLLQETFLYLQMNELETFFDIAKKDKNQMVQC